MTSKLIFGDCDCCGKPNRVLHFALAHSIETWACAECHGNKLSDDVDDLNDEIYRLNPKAETSEQHAHLCSLYAALEEAEARL
jgi:hypothetical protein